MGDWQICAVRIWEILPYNLGELYVVAGLFHCFCIAK